MLVYLKLYYMDLLIENFEHLNSTGLKNQCIYNLHLELMFEHL